MESVHIMRLGAVITGIVLALVLVVGVLSMTQIEQGHRGVIYDRQEGVQKETLPEGVHFISPLKRVTAYPSGAITSVDVKEFEVITNDGKVLKVSASYDYINSPEMLPHIYTKFKGAEPDEIEAGWLERRFKTSAIKVYAKYSVVEVFQNQGKITASLLEDFKKSVEGEGFLVDSAFTSAPKGDKATNEAVQKVVQASQVLEELRIQEEQAEVRNRTRIMNENTDAEALKIRSQAEADANHRIAKSISEALVQYESLKKWNGELPQVTGGATPFVNLENTPAKKASN